MALSLSQWDGLMDDHMVTIGYAWCAVLSVVAIVHEWDPYAGLWCGIVGGTVILVWEASQQ